MASQAPAAKLAGHYDYVVIGCGGIGSGTLYWLSKTADKAKRILGLEQFSLGHSNGGSQDHSRIVRRMYHDAVYAKLAGGAMDAWHALERDSQHRLVDHCGGVHVMDKGDPVLADVLAAAKAQGLKYDFMSGSELNRRYPQFATDDSVEVFIDYEAGFVDAAQANAVHVALARQRGATVVDNCKVIKINRRAPTCYEITTSLGAVTAEKIVITSGAWSNQILANFAVNLPLTVRQEQVHYYATPFIQDFLPAKFPVWLWVDNGDVYYGMPIHGIMGMKVGWDMGGAKVTADTRSFQPDEYHIAKNDAFVKRFFPKAYGPKALVKTCLYTVTPDRHFVVDTLAGCGHPNVSVCIGAGHAFKFAGVLGQILTTIAITGKTDKDISTFSLGRRALTDPNFGDQSRNFGTLPPEEQRSAEKSKL